MLLLSDTNSILLLVSIGGILLACSAGLFLTSAKRSMPPDDFFAYPPPSTEPSNPPRGGPPRQEGSAAASFPGIPDMSMDKTLVESGDSDLDVNFHEAKTMIEENGPGSASAQGDFQDNATLIDDGLRAPEAKKTEELDAFSGASVHEAKTMIDERPWPGDSGIAPGQTSGEQSISECKTMLDDGSPEPKQPESAAGGKAPSINECKTLIDDGTGDFSHFGDSGVDESFYDGKTMIGDSNSAKPVFSAGLPPIPVIGSSTTDVIGVLATATCQEDEATAVMENRSLEKLACLFIMNGNFAGKVFKINPDGTSIGSGENCAVILNHKGVPPLKAQLCFDAGRWLITDVAKGSEAKLLTGGRAVSRTYLADGTVIRIGEVDMMFRVIC